MTTTVVWLMALMTAASPGESELRVRVDPVIDRAVDIAVADIRSCKTATGFQPDSSRHYDGVWLADSVSTLAGYRYFGADCEQRLRALVSRFSVAQDADGTIPMVFWGKEGTVDFGGRYDLAENRKQARDMENAYLFVHANYLLWKDFGDEASVRQHFQAIRKAVDALDRRTDAATGLILATYGPPNSDVSVDHAIPQTTAHVYFNVLYAQAYRELAEMAGAMGYASDAENYRAKAIGLVLAINRFLWHEDRGRFEAKILRSPVTTDKTRPAYRITEDRCFPVVDNMIALHHNIPATPRQSERLVRQIEGSERGLRVWGRMAAPVYPDGFFTEAKLFDGGNYHNGDVWTWFSNKYAIALVRMGWPSKATELLKRQAAVAMRDGGFSEFYEDDASGARKGAFHYAGSASSYLQAVVEGLCGLQMDAPAGKVLIHPSFLHSGEFRSRLGRYVFQVAIRVNETACSAKISIATSFRGKAEMRIRLPSETRHCRVLRRAKAEVPAEIGHAGEVTCAILSDDLCGNESAWDLRW
jgi:hypothetical protein